MLANRGFVTWSKKHPIRFEWSLDLGLSIRYTQLRRVYDGVLWEFVSVVSIPLTMQHRNECNLVILEK